MAQTITNEDLYVAITPYKVGSNNFDTICVSISYRKGKGFYASVQPGWYSGGVWGCVYDFSSNPLTAGKSVLVKSASKNSKKLLEAMYDNLCALPARKIVSAIFDMRDWNALQAALYAIAGDPSWATEERYQGYKAVIDKENNNNNNNSNNQNSTTMANASVKGADLIGKTLVMGNGVASYVVTSVDEDEQKVFCTFKMTGKPDLPMKMGIKQFMDIAGSETAHWQDEATDNAPIATESKDENDVQEVDASEAISEGIGAKVVPITERPKTENEPENFTKVDEYTVKGENGEDVKFGSYAPNVGAGNATDNTDAAPVAEAPKATESKPVAEQPKAATTKSKGGKKKGVYYVADDKTRKGKPYKMIIVPEKADPNYQSIPTLDKDYHVFKKTDKPANGKRYFAVAFGPKYAPIVQSVCDALNEGKTLAECKSIIEGNTEELHRQAAERKADRDAKRAEYLANRDGGATPNEQPKSGISKDDVAGLGEFLRKVMAGDKDAMALANKLMAA